MHFYSIKRLTMLKVSPPIRKKERKILHCLRIKKGLKTSHLESWIIVICEVVIGRCYRLV